jgi:hypothetical protein
VCAADTPRMHRIWIPLPALATLAALALTLVAALGCSKSGGCDSSQCAAGNQCIDDGSGSGPTCHAVCVKQADCPANYLCNDGQANGGTVSWCVPNVHAYTPGPGEWGAQCAASKGEGANPDCNWAMNFACYAQSPTDANAFCTQFACATDDECPGGWWCSTQNVGPNATSTAATYGKTRNICLPRSYCAPCKKDLDCYAPAGSTPVHCVPDVNGATFCAPQCASTANCAFDATCTAPWKVCTPAAAGGQACTTDDQCPPSGSAYQHCVGGACTPECSSVAGCAAGQTCVANTTVCVPRAGVCVGDGSFCSPCRSDDDCVGKTSALSTPRLPGYCLSSEPYSTEHFCSAPATISDCDAQAPDPTGCPSPQPGQNWRVTACTDVPPDQCIGVVSFGTASGTPVGIPGCWTVNR